MEFRTRLIKFRRRIIQVLKHFRYQIHNVIYEIGILHNFPLVINKWETLDLIKNQQKSIARYGDAEFNIINGHHSIGFQDYNEKLAQRLSNILISKNENILIGIPKVFSDLRKFKSKSRSFWREYLYGNRASIYSRLDLNKRYYDSLVTRLYITSREPYGKIADLFAQWIEVWKDREIIIIEGKGKYFGGGNDLLETAASVQRIYAPSKNAFNEYEEILRKGKQISREKLLLISLGPTATLLAYDLCESGYQAIDIGNLDNEYELFRIHAKEKSELIAKVNPEIEPKD
jgi:glycosyltransferase family protein